MNISFVILHYNVIEETTACINSIKAHCDTNDYAIVIVDNGSPNNSGRILKKRYLNDSKVHIILSEENLGFAKGNNLGIDYSRKTLNANFVCCLNNDTILQQYDFWKNLSEAYVENPVAVFGPKVILADGTVQKFAPKIADVKTYKRVLLALTKESKVEYVKMQIKGTKLFKKINSYRRKIKGIEIDPNVARNGVLLHGCCLIFTPRFFETLSGFDNRTFLYREEELLFLMLKKNNLTTSYIPSLSIIHMEDASTNSISLNKKQKSDFKNQCLIESTRILIDTLETLCKETKNML